MRDEETSKQERTDQLNAEPAVRVIDGRALPDHVPSVRFLDGTQGEENLSRLVVGPNGASSPHYAIEPCSHKQL